MIKFVQSLNQDGGGFAPLGQGNIEFIAFGDIQFTDGTPRGTPRQYMFRDSLLYVISEYGPTDFLLSVGDYGETKVVNGDPTQYDELNGFLNLHSGDKYNCFGNHDTAFPSLNHVDDLVDFLSYTPFKSLGGMDTVGYGYEKRSDNGLHVILMNSMENAYQGAAGGSQATGHFFYLQSQVDWLSETLNSITEEDARVLIVTHAPWKTDTFGVGQIEREYRHEQAQADECINICLTWQENSNNGLILGVISGHTHIDGSFLSDNGVAKMNHFSLDEFDGVPSGYTGTASETSTDTQYMSVARFFWNESQKVLTVTGYGEQDSYLIDMSDRVS